MPRPRMPRSARTSSHPPRLPRRLLLAALPLALLAGVAVPSGAAPARAGRAAAPFGLVSGPDVSSHQHSGTNGVGWGRVASSGRAFAVVKATEGAGYTNPFFARDWAGMRSAGLVRAAYHYARPAASLGTATAQARRFVRTVAPVREQGTLPLVLDIEETGRLRPAQLQAWTRQFLTTVEGLTGRTPIVYTYPWFWTHRMANSQDFTRYPLWIAAYSGAPPNPLPGGWPSWTLWQYSDRGRVAGVRGRVDVSVFCCSPAALTALADAGASTITQRWAALGGAAGALGAPLGRESTVGPGRTREFVGGTVWWTRETGAHAVLAGPVRDRYRDLGGPLGALGFPSSDSGPVDGAPVGASVLVTPGGRLYAGPADLTAWLLPTGVLLDDWLARGGAAGLLGLPVADQVSVPGGDAATFAGGQLLSSPDRGVHELHGGVLAGWLAAGGASSAYGLPSSDTYVVPEGLRADFGGLAITTAG